jgi:hypothetical protein
MPMPLAIDVVSPEGPAAWDRIPPTTAIGEEVDARHREAPLRDAHRDRGAPDRSALPVGQPTDRRADYCTSGRALRPW